MKTLIFAFALLGAAGTASAQQYAASDGYRVCATAATTAGIEAARAACGAVTAPDFSTLQINSESELKTLEQRRDGFRVEVQSYGQCVTQLINSYRRPGAPADSPVPDQAACAHSWAEDQATQIVRQFGKACIDYSNRSMMSPDLPPYDGACYPSAGNARG
ncbi:MAG: hypothetical protein QNI84_00770 [Henriciella sp.]|nr:hypothetical protein [Henriciella sp.]